MKGRFWKVLNHSNIRVNAPVLIFALFMVSCTHIDPAKVNIDIAKTQPMAKITSYTESLGKLGLMSEIYATELLKIQSTPINDYTGSSEFTGGEIPRDITEIVKSVLNNIGGNLIYIPYDPVFVQNQMITGYSNFQNKLIPDIVVSGGITEFDRGLETREKNNDASSRITYEGLPDYLPGLDGEVPYPSKEMNLRYGDSGKSGLARITLDFNLLNFQSMAGIAKMSTVNTIEVQKAMAGEEFGISIFAQAFGRRGQIKKVQGRHAAIRLLVELSMIQIIGRQLILPYWNLLGEEALPDKVVIESASTFYQGLGNPQKVAFTQQLLFLLGYDVQVNGLLSDNTGRALQNFHQTDDLQEVFNTDHFLKLWSSVPINKQSWNRRRLLTQREQERRSRQAAPKANKKVSKPKPKPKPKKSNQIDELLRMLEKKRKAR